jgi:hypothetical protein
MAPVRADVSSGDRSIFMASGWLGKSHGTLLKNSFDGLFHPKSDTNRHQTRCFFGYWSPMSGRNQLNANFFNSAPWPLPGHPEAMKMDPSP